MTGDQLTAEARYAATLIRLEGLVAAGVIAEVQAARIAVRIADRSGATLGGLNARVRVDLACAPSDL